METSSADRPSAAASTGQEQIFVPLREAAGDKIGQASLSQIISRVIRIEKILDSGRVQAICELFGDRGAPRVSLSTWEVLVLPNGPAALVDFAKNPFLSPLSAAVWSPLSVDLPAGEPTQAYSSTFITAGGFLAMTTKSIASAAECQQLADWLDHCDVKVNTIPSRYFPPVPLEFSRSVWKLAFSGADGVLARILKRLSVTVTQIAGRPASEVILSSWSYRSTQLETAVSSQGVWYDEHTDSPQAGFSVSLSLESQPEGGGELLLRGVDGSTILVPNYGAGSCTTFRGYAVAHSVASLRGSSRKQLIAWFSLRSVTDYRLLFGSSHYIQFTAYKRATFYFQDYVRRWMDDVLFPRFDTRGLGEWSDEDLDRWICEANGGVPATKDQRELLKSTAYQAIRSTARRIGFSRRHLRYIYRMQANWAVRETVRELERLGLQLRPHDELLRDDEVWLQGVCVSGLADGALGDE